MTIKANYVALLLYLQDLIYILCCYGGQLHFARLCKNMQLNLIHLKVVYWYDLFSLLDAGQ